jgi:hypothetical protein
LLPITGAPFFDVVGRRVASEVLVEAVFTGFASAGVTPLVRHGVASESHVAGRTAGGKLDREILTAIVGFAPGPSSHARRCAGAVDITVRCRVTTGGAAKAKDDGCQREDVR